MPTENTGEKDGELSDGEDSKEDPVRTPQGSVSNKKRKATDMKDVVVPRLEQYLTRKPSSSPIWANFLRYGPTAPAELHQLAICELCTKAEVYYEFKTKDGCTSALVKHLLHVHPPAWEEYKSAKDEKKAVSDAAGPRSASKDSGVKQDRAKFSKVRKSTAGGGVMGTVVNFAGALGYVPLETRACFALGYKVSLCTVGAFAVVKPLMGDMVSDAAYHALTLTLEPSAHAGDSVQLAGKHAGVACLPDTCSRNNCPARPDAVKALLKGWLSQKRHICVVLLCPVEHRVALATAIVRACPPLFTCKTPADPFERKVTVLIPGADATLCRKLDALAYGVQLAARLVDAPPNILHTDAYLEEVKAVAASPAVGGKVSLQIIRGKELEAKGMGGLWNVGKASEHPPSLAILSYDPQSPPVDGKTIVWVGKGIIYDTGGLSIKGKFDMPSMKQDMGGSAGILGAFAATTRIGTSIRLRAVLCLAENSVDERAMRPDDIITLLSGKTCEVNNTDAEGRLVLADGCHYAAATLGATTIVDMATLTGAQVTATGKKHAAVLCNDEETERAAVAAGKSTGDMLFPIIYCPELFMEQAFKSEVADMKNSADDRKNALASCAGHFIEANLPSDFTGKWVHIDMAAPVSEGQRGTGWGVPLLMRMFGII